MEVDGTIVFFNEAEAVCDLDAPEPDDLELKAPKKKKLYQQILIKLIQLFFCVLDRHNRNPCLYTDSDYNRIFYFRQSFRYGLSS